MGLTFVDVGIAADAGFAHLCFESVQDGDANQPVLTAQEDGTTRLPDTELLMRAGTLGRILFTQDDDFLVEAARQHQTGASFATVIYAHQFTAIGVCVADLSLILSAMLPEEARDCVIHLPL